MTKTGKIILITSSLVLATAAIAFAMRKKKPAPVKKRTGSVIVDDEIPGTVSGIALQQGSTDETNVLRLKEAINQYHQAVVFINNNCSGVKWPLFRVWKTDANGKLLPENILFDDNTEQVVQYYFNRKEVEIPFLNKLRLAMDSYRKGTKCIHPSQYMK